MKLERLQKVIAMRGYCSRRRAEKLILEKKVTVDGVVITELGYKVKLNAEISIENQKLPFEPIKKLYLAFNKPAGCITSAYDPQKRPLIFDYLKDIKTRIYPIGRLDYNTTGLLLLTNDGDFANTVMHPTHQVNKVYVVTVDGTIDLKKINKLLSGIIIDDDFLAKAVAVRLLSQKLRQQKYGLEITIQDGHNHQIRKMIQAIHGEVITLERIAIGAITLKGMARGAYRELSAKEIAAFKNNIKIKTIK